MADAKKRQLDSARRSSEIRAGIFLGSLLIEKIGGPESAARFVKAAESLNKLEQLVRSTTLQGLKATPLTLTMGWTNLAIGVLDLFGPLGKPDPTIEILVQISEQIEILHMDMLDGFNKLSKQNAEILFMVRELYRELNLQNRVNVQLLNEVKKEIDLSRRESWRAGIDEYGTKMKRGEVATQIGLSYIAEGRPDDARSNLDEALKIFKTHASAASFTSTYSGADPGLDLGLVKSLVRARRNISVTVGALPKALSLISPFDKSVAADFRIPNPDEWSIAASAIAYLKLASYGTESARDEILADLISEGENAEKAVIALANAGNVKKTRQNYESCAIRFGMKIIDDFEDFHQKNGGNDISKKYFGPMFLSGDRGLPGILPRYYETPTDYANRDYRNFGWSPLYNNGSAVLKAIEECPGVTLVRGKVGGMYLTGHTHIHPVDPVFIKFEKNEWNSWDFVLGGDATKGKPGVYEAFKRSQYKKEGSEIDFFASCLLYTSPSPRD